MANVCGGGGNNLCGCPAGTRECGTGTSDCVPNNQCCNCGGPCQTCNNGTCGAVADGQPGRCPAGQECRTGGCVTAAPPATLATSVAPDPIPLTRITEESAQVRWVIINNGGQSTQPLTLSQTGFDPNEIFTESTCLGLSLAPGNTCLIRISFRPRAPVGTRAVTLTVNAGSLQVSARFDIPVRQGPAGPCTLGTPNECAPGLFCTAWYLDQDRDGYGGEPRLGGAPTLSVCSNGLAVGRPADVIQELGPVFGTAIMPYLLLTGDCCDLPGGFNGGGIASGPFQVNPGVTMAVADPAVDCPNPDDFNCDGVAACIPIPAEDGTSCL
jgi:hypothetical protein